jgi:YfiH family protein
VSDRDRSWSLEVINGFEVARCAALDSSGLFRHRFSTRVGGGSCGAGDHLEGVAPLDDVVAYRAGVVQAAGLNGLPVLLQQVHGNRLVTLHDANRYEQADGLLLTAHDVGQVAGIRTADCFPVLMVDPAAGLGAALHAGWRGAAAGIVTKAVRAMEDRGGDVSRMVAAAGPGIGSCCFKVGPEVVEALPGAKTTIGTEGCYLDLASGILNELIGAGMQADNIHLSPWCTFCENDRFYSFRRDGKSAGRMLTVLGVA